MSEREECGVRVPRAARGVKLTWKENLGSAHSHPLPKFLRILGKEFQVISILTAQLGVIMLITNMFEIAFD